MKRRKDRQIDESRAPRTRLGRDPLIAVAVLAATVHLLVVWLPNVPLGVPGEWVWERIDLGPGDGARLFLGIVFGVPFAAMYWLFCHLAEGRLAEATRAARVGWLGGLVLAGFGWLWVAQEAAPREEYRLGRAPFVLVYPGVSGYFTEARAATEFRRYLADYEAKMAEGDVLHIGTHPPGLIIAHRILLAAYRHSPALTEGTLATRPASVREAQDVIAALPQAGGPLTRAELAELWAATLLVQAAAAAAVVPLFCLVQRLAGAVVAWRVAALWPLVVALPLFLPKSDALFPLVGLGVLALWHRPGPPGLFRAIAAGGLFWLGLNLSLAMLPVAALAGALTVQSLLIGVAAPRWSLGVAYARDTAAAAAMFLTLTAWTWIACDLNLFAVWSWNYHNHAGFYEAFHRTYWKWLLVNPIELAFGLGLPAFVAVVMALRGMAIGGAGPAVPVLAVVGLLWLSGKNSGEAARLWIFLLPWLLWISTPFWTREAGARRWRVILALQLAISLLTAMRMSGFHFGELAGGAG